MNTWRSRARAAVCVVLTSLGLMWPATAQAQVRLETAFNWFGSLWTRASYNGGATWEPWLQMYPYGCGTSTPIHFVGAPAIVSDRPGILRAVAKTASGGLFYSDSDGNTWACWTPVWAIAPGYRFPQDSFPAVSSFAPGRLDVWMVGQRSRDGALALLHAWFTDGDFMTWHNFETLGSGLIWGTPAVTSWGPGRIDVFVRAADNGLAHKWFEGGRWSRGWEDMGASLVSNPTVASQGPGQLDLYAVGTDRALTRMSLSNGVWSGWENLGGILGLDTDPAASSAGPGNVEIFVLAADLRSVFQRTYTWGVGTAVLNHVWPSGVPPISVAHWVP